MNKKVLKSYWEDLDKYVLSKKEYCFPNKILDINDCWWLFNRDSLCEDNDRSIYWFDKVSYSFIQYKDIDKNDVRFIKCIDFDTNELYSFYEKKINQKTVTEYFESADTLDERYIRFRKFIDWNRIDITYDRYIAVSHKLITWCIQNEIVYTFTKIPPPDNYIFKNDRYKQIIWQIPD